MPAEAKTHHRLCLLLLPLLLIGVVVVSLVGVAIEALVFIGVAGFAHKVLGVPPGVARMFGVVGTFLVVVVTLALLTTRAGTPAGADDDDQLEALSRGDGGNASPAK